jgi:hypothetical protein
MRKESTHSQQIKRIKAHVHAHVLKRVKKRTCSNWQRGRERGREGEIGICPPNHSGCRQEAETGVKAQVARAARSAGAN